MIQAGNLLEIKSEIQENKLALLYVSREDCSVCHSLLPQIEQLLTNYPTIKSIRVDADAIPEIAGEYSIFTVPAILVFAEGKEMIRKARFVPIDELNRQLSKLVSLVDSFVKMNKTSLKKDRE